MIGPIQSAPVPGEAGTQARSAEAQSAVRVRQEGAGRTTPDLPQLITCPDLILHRLASIIATAPQCLYVGGAHLPKTTTSPSKAVNRALLSNDADVAVRADAEKQGAEMISMRASITARGAPTWRIPSGW